MPVDMISELPVENLDEQLNDEMETETEENLIEAEKEALLLREKQYFKDQRIIELAKASFPNTTSQHYTKGSVFSPDGLCILTTVNSNGMLVYELPSDLYGKEEIADDREINLLNPVIHVKAVGNIYDFCWFPLMNSSIPDTCYWLATAQNEPIKMYDAFNGKYKCSYRSYDYADELEAALSVCYSGNGEKVFGGYKKNINIFDTSVPGRCYQTIKMNQPTSCIATNYYDEHMIACGSWNKSIQIYDIRESQPIEHLTGHKGGVTYLKFSMNGDYLISGARKDSNFLFWDMRDLSLPLYRFQRQVSTNQKIYFDISAGNTWVASGDTRGLVHIWNTTDLNDDGFPKEIQVILILIGFPYNNLMDFLLVPTTYRLLLRCQFASISSYISFELGSIQV